MKNWKRIKFPANLVRQAEQLFEEEPFLNLNCYWVGVDSFCVEGRFLDDVMEILGGSEIPVSAVGISDLT